jgi:hypothetical protein
MVGIHMCCWFNGLEFADCRTNGLFAESSRKMRPTRSHFCTQITCQVPSRLTKSSMTHILHYLAMMIWIMIRISRLTLQSARTKVGRFPLTVPLSTRGWWEASLAVPPMEQHSNRSTVCGLQDLTCTIRRAAKRFWVLPRVRTCQGYWSKRSVIHRLVP